MRIFYFILGWAFFALGAIGVVLPVLPTTPFMILALWAFSKSSDRFYQWLYHHRFFGPPLQKWKEYRVIPLAAKVMSIGFMTASLVYMIIYSPVDLWLQAGIVMIMLYGAWFILTKPSRPPKPEDKKVTPV